MTQPPRQAFLRGYIDMRAERDDWVERCRALTGKLTEAAAFLDTQADTLHALALFKNAADCRAMAKKLRGELRGET